MGLFGYLLLYSGLLQSVSTSESSSEEDLYLYEGVEGAEDVQEYLDRKSTRPDFLYKAESQPARLVEFYAPWCPHCQHFKEHYMKLATQVKSIARDQGMENVEVHAISCVAHKQLCKNNKINGYPRVYVFPAGSSNTTHALQYWKMHPLQVVNIMAGGEPNNLEPHFDIIKETKRQASGLRKRWFANNQSTKAPTPIRTKQNVFDDAYKSLDFNIRTGIYMTNGPMNNDTRDAFHAWVDLLVDTLPPTWSLAQKPLRALQERKDNITQGEEALVKVWDEHAAKPAKRWSDACSHGEAGGGYTCGLWQIFHILTVGATEWNLMLFNPKDDYNQLDLAKAAVTLRNFVDHFFACDVCKVHFVTSFDNCDLDRCDRIKQNGKTRKDFLQFAIWLFETHNAVNKRLLREKADREHQQVHPEDEIRVQYPSREACPSCWNQDGSWDEENIYRYLRLEYWPEDSVSPILRKELVSGSTDLGDDEDMTEPPSVYFQMSLAVTVVGLAATWYVKRLALRKTGHHKRIS